eukprot:11014824-Karenia_brevis.AAC.1
MRRQCVHAVTSFNAAISACEKGHVTCCTHGDMDMVYMDMAISVCEQGGQWVTACVISFNTNISVL